MELPDSKAYTEMISNNLSNFNSGLTKANDPIQIDEEKKTEMVNEILNMTLESTKNGEFPAILFNPKLNFGNLRFIDLLGDIIRSSGLSAPSQIHSIVTNVASILNDTLNPYGLKLEVERKGMAQLIKVTQLGNKESGANKK